MKLFHRPIFSMLAFVVFALAFVSIAPASENAEAFKAPSSVQQDAPITTDANTVTAEAPSFAIWTRESVGATVLNVQRRTYSPVKELEGYRTLLDRPDIGITYAGSSPEHFAGFSNNRAREKV